MTFIGYAIALSISLYILWTFGWTDGLALTQLVKEMTVLGFPAALGAGAARLLFLTRLICLRRNTADGDASRTQTRWLAVVGLLFVVGSFAILLRESFSAGRPVANIRVRVDEVLPSAHGYLVSLKIDNTGNATAASLVCRRRVDPKWNERRNQPGDGGLRRRALPT